MRRRKQEAAPSKPAVSLSAGAQSEKGLREENQDRMTRFNSPFGEVLLVADGMGGHLGGATAAETIVSKFPVNLSNMSPATPLADALQQTARVVNQEIFQRGHAGDASVAGMGSTLVLAVIRETPSGHEAVVANAGDSRAYLLRNGSLRRLTKDHTAVQRMVDAGLLTEAGSRQHPDASMLTRAFGQAQDLSLEIYPPVPLQPDDALLLCSDGLSGFTDDAEMEARLAKMSDPGAAVQSLVELALARGSDDNITVQLLRVVSNAPPIPAAAEKLRIGTRELSYVLAGVLAIAGAAGMVKWYRDRAVEKVEIQVKNGDEPKTVTTSKTKPGKKRPPASKNSEKVDPEPPEHESKEKDPEKDNIEVEVQGDEGSPEWIDQLKKKLPNINVRNGHWQSKKKYKPYKNEVRFLYHPSAEKYKDRVLRLIPESQKVREEADATMAFGTDIIIILPTEPMAAVEPCDPDGSEEKSCAEPVRFAAKWGGDSYGKQL